MAAAFTFRDLDAWKQAMDLAERCYHVTAAFPRSEAYGLGGQLRRAAASIASNIAEGQCRRSTRAYAYHLTVALGSQGELITCLELATRLGFLNQDESSHLVASAESVGRLVNGLHRALRTKLIPDP